MLLDLMFTNAVDTVKDIKIGGNLAAATKP